MPLFRSFIRRQSFDCCCEGRKSFKPKDKTEDEDILSLVKHI